MCYGETRIEAIDRMRRALNEFIIEGVDTKELLLKGEQNEHKDSNN